MTVRKAALVVAALAGALLLAIGGAAAWLLSSAPGTAWLLTRVPLVQVTGPQGRLFGGPFAAERIVVRAAGREIALQRLAWQDARWTLRPHAGAWVGLVVDGASVETLQVGAPTAPSTGGPPQPPASLRLPLALTLAPLRIGTLQLQDNAVLREIEARIELGRDGGREHRVQGLVGRSDRAALDADARIAADAPFALDATLAARALPDAARPWQAEARASGPLQAFAVDARLTSPQAADAQLDARATVSPFAAWPLSTLAADAREIDLAALVAGGPRTRLSGQAQIDTRGLDQPVTARVKLSNAEPGRWDEQRLPLATIELDASARPDQRDRLTLQRFELVAPGDGGRVSGQGQWRGGEATLDLVLHALRPSRLDARAPAMTLSGSVGSRLTGLPPPDGSAAAGEVQQLQGRVAIDGRLDAPRSAPVRLAGALQARRAPDGWQAELSDASARAGDATLAGTLALDQRAGGPTALRTQGRAQGFDPSAWWAAAPPARLSGRWQTELQAPAAWRLQPQQVASWLALRGRLQADLADSTLAGVPLAATLRADTPAAGGWKLDATAQAAANRVQWAGTLAPRADGDRWQVEVQAPALAALRPVLAALNARALADGLAGSLQGNAQLAGRWPALRTSGSLRASDARVQAFAAAQLDLQWQAGDSRDAPLALALDGRGLAAGTQRIDTLRARVDGTLSAHRVEADATSALRPPAWTDAALGLAPQKGSVLKLRGDGRWQPATGGAASGRWQARLAELDARGREAPQPWLAARDLALSVAFDVNGRPVEATLPPGRVSLLGAALTWREAHWMAAAPDRPAVMALDASLEPMAVVPWLARWQPGAGVGGDLTIKGSAVLRRGQNFAADIVIERAGGDLSVTSEGVTQTLGLSDLRLSLSADQGTWHFTQALAGRNMGVLAGAQSLRVPPTAPWPLPDTPMQGVLEWGVADLGVWAPFTPPGWRVGGRLRTSAAIGGRFGAPEIEGRMEGSQLAVRNLLQGVDVRDGELALSLRGSEARVERFFFKGGDGTLRLTGGATLGAQPRATLQMTAEDFRVLGRSDRRIDASGNATLVLDAKSLALDGRFTIDEGLIDISRRDAPSLDSDITVRGGRHGVRDPGADQPAEAPAPRVPIVQEVKLAVQLDLGRRLRLVGRGIDTRLAGRLDITAPGGQLAVNGEVRAQDGQYAAYGQQLDIERGVIAFSGEPANPRLDILAVRPNLDVQVGVQIDGRAQAPRVRLVSTPEMSDYDKLSWLVLGRAPEGLARNDTALLQRAALALLAGENQSQDMQLLSTLGLDSLSLRQVETGDVRETVVSLGKQLSRRWYVGYERSVNQTTGSWQLVYRVAQRFTLRAQSGEDSSLDAIWTWRWN